VSNSFTVFEMWSETNLLILKDKIQDLFSFSKLRFSKIGCDLFKDIIIINVTA